MVSKQAADDRLAFGVAVLLFLTVFAAGIVRVTWIRSAEQARIDPVVRGWF